ncbi:MAG: hypothetical protein VX683_00565, partial [Cyanobacteriota bacterium]|nr:hypothetical protein [Cyanobacteriota bacterium]
FSSDDDDDVSKTGDSPFTGSSPLKDPLKHGLSSMESIAAATEQVATTLATGLMHAVSNATRALGVAGQTKLDAMQRIADGIKSQLNTKLAAVQAIADGIQTQLRALSEDKAELRSFTDWVPEWGVLNKQQKVECINCSLYFALHGCPSKNHKRCVWLHQNGGRAKDKQPSFWAKAVKEHEGSAMHKWCEQHAQSTKSHVFGAIGAAMDKQKEQARANAKKLFRCVVYCARRFKAFREYPHLVQLLKECGCELRAQSGLFCRTTRSLSLISLRLPAASSAKNARLSSCS